ncbi:hypothetical protein J4727_17165 [Providencia rettgeri]|uniref:Uncharacterized protein n=1 Tax=Providencia rettgeri TaxID=587 RepID=A0A939NBD0_PRORE|nr:hypothetical protein [Providencia rettgeri]
MSVAAPLLLGKRLEFGGFIFAIFPVSVGRQYETDNLFQLESGTCWDVYTKLASVKILHFVYNGS